MAEAKPRVLKTVLRRFTNLASLIHILQTKSITLLNPAAWDDKNDAHFMAEYKRKVDAQTVLALCFTQSQETYHHWRVFSGGPNGVCIDFLRSPLVKMFDNADGVTARYVSYKMLGDIKLGDRIDVVDLPFLKRAPYTDEMEYRAVYVSKNEDLDSLDLPFDLSWIKSITLSPWMPPVQKESVKQTLKSIPGCSDLKIVRSSLIENATWRKMAAEAADLGAQR